MTEKIQFPGFVFMFPQIVPKQLGEVGWQINISAKNYQSQLMSVEVIVCNINGTQQCKAERWVWFVLSTANADTSLMLCHSQWSAGSSELCFVLPPVSTSSCTWNKLSVFLFLYQSLYSNCSLVVHCTTCLVMLSLLLNSVQVSFSSWRGLHFIFSTYITLHYVSAIICKHLFIKKLETCL